MLSLAKLAIEPKANPLSSAIPPETRSQISNNAYPVFASLSWAFVMYLFRWYPETLVSSLRSSMVYMYVYPCVWQLFCSFWLMPVQLRRFGPLGLIPKLPHTQQISTYGWPMVYRPAVLPVSVFIFMLYYDLFGHGLRDMACIWLGCSHTGHE